MSSIGEALQLEIARVRDEVMPRYIEIGDVGRPALFMMRQDLDAASKAIMEGDLPGMIKAYESLKGYSV